ncbi:MAG: hypothetical protein RLZZ28_1602 [Bacteroidota bacterium]
MHLLWKIAQKAERKWWQIYLKDKDVINYQKSKTDYWTNLLASVSEVASVSPNDQILDAGCGPAGIFMVFSQHRVTAFDPLLEKYASDLPHFSKANYPHVDFHTAVVEEFSSEKKYDLIFCMNAINHVFDITKGYKNLASLLKPGGKLVISIDAHNHPFFKYLFRFLPGDILHPCQYDLAEYAAFLQQQGLVIQKTVKIKSSFFFNHYVQVAEKS